MIESELQKMKPSEILRQAFASFGENGEYWIKGFWHRKVWTDSGIDHYFCSWGAINWIHPLDGYAESHLLPNYRAFKWLNNAVSDFNRWDYPMTPVTFNDMPETTWDDVRRVWQIAIDAAESHGE